VPQQTEIRGHRPAQQHPREIVIPPKASNLKGCHGLSTHTHATLHTLSTKACPVEDKRPLCQLSSKRLNEKWHNWYNTALFLYTTLPHSGERLSRSRCFVEDKRPLCQLSSKRLNEKWHNWYSTALFLYTTLRHSGERLSGADVL